MSTRTLAAMALALLMTGCATTHTPPPEPNMNRLVNVNQEVPAELYQIYSAEEDKESE